jgi:uncharacterized SAM-binding protein YcdF (DUF218 family)
MKKSKKSGWLLIAILIVLIISFHRYALQAMGNYLLSEDQPVKSDVIIVLGGETEGERTERAVTLYKSGMAHQLLFSDGTTLSWRIHAIDEMIALARELGVPEQAIFREERSRSTYENALFTKEILEKKHWKSAIIVTTNWHTRRSRFIFDKVYQNSGIRLTYVGAKDKHFASLSEGWLDPEKQQTVLTEWAKLFVYYIRYW